MATELGSDWAAELLTRAVVFANGGAGSFSQFAEIGAQSLLQKCCHQIHVTKSVSEVESILKATFAAIDRPLLVAAGGDGTVNTLINIATEMKGTTFDLAILPLGTGNDLARTFDIPLDLDEAIKVLLTGTLHPLDLWSVQAENIRRVMVNSLALGQPASVGKETKSEQKKREGTWSYVKNGTRLFAAEPLDFCICLNDDPPFDIIGSGLIFTNGQTIAGGLRISPSANAGDGSIELKVIEGEGWGDQMLSKVLVLFGTDQEGRSHSGITKATVKSRQDVEVSIDGEVNFKLPVSIEYLDQIRIVGPIRALEA